MNGIPKEVDEAAKIDGCGTMQIFFYIIGPMSKPTLIVSALLNLYGHGKMYGIPIFILEDQKGKQFQ